MLFTLLCENTISTPFRWTRYTNPRIFSPPPLCLRLRDKSRSHLDKRLGLNICACVRQQRRCLAAMKGLYTAGPVIYTSKKQTPRTQIVEEGDSHRRIYIGENRRRRKLLFMIIISWYHSEIASRRRRWSICIECAVFVRDALCIYSYIT